MKRHFDGTVGGILLEIVFALGTIGAGICISMLCLF